MLLRISHANAIKSHKTFNQNYDCQTMRRTSPKAGIVRHANGTMQKTKQKTMM